MLLSPRVFGVGSVRRAAISACSTALDFGFGPKYNFRRRRRSDEECFSFRFSCFTPSSRPFHTTGAPLLPVKGKGKGKGGDRKEKEKAKENSDPLAAAAARRRAASASASLRVERGRGSARPQQREKLKKDSSANPPQKRSFGRFYELIKTYGRVAVFTYLGIYAATFAGIYGALEFGLVHDIPIDKAVEIIETKLVGYMETRGADTASVQANFDWAKEKLSSDNHVTRHAVVALLGAELTSPIRDVATLMLTRPLAKAFGYVPNTEEGKNGDKAS